MNPIPVAERLPLKNNVVLAFDSHDREWYFSVYNDDLQWEVVGHGSQFEDVILDYVTHWVELIDPTVSPKD